MNKPAQKIMAGVAGAVLLASGTGAALAAQQPATAEEGSRPAGATHTVADLDIRAQWLGEESDYVRVADVQGSFTFNQEGVTPNDELFNVFGTAILSMCSKPAPELAAEQDGVANYYVNVGGQVKENFTVNLSELDDEEQEALMGCSCATGSPFGQAAVIGVPLASVVGMAELEDGVNTVTAYGADGYGEPLPLQYALDKNALLVYRVNGEELKASEGSSVQLWMPETVARPRWPRSTPCTATRSRSRTPPTAACSRRATRSRSRAWPTTAEAPSRPSSSPSTAGVPGRRARRTAPPPTSG